MEISNTIDILNKLVKVNNERIEGYETALKETFEEDLKSLFTRFAHTSHNCKDELIDEIYKLGGDPDEGQHAPGRFFGVWIDMKVALAEHDRKTIFDSCEFGEDMTIASYGKVLDDATNLSIELHNMVQMQYGLIKIDRVRINAMRETLPIRSLVIYSPIFVKYNKEQEAGPFLPEIKFLGTSIQIK